MATNSSNVTTGKAAVGGAIFVAPVGTTLPTNPTDTLNSAFVGLGYASDAGLTLSTALSNEAVKAWGGDTVMMLHTDKTETFKFKLIEILSEDVLKTIYGSSNITTSGSVTTVKSNADEPAEMAWVFEMIMRDDKVKRIVVPRASLTALGDIVYTDTEVSGYDCTLTALSDSTGVTHYEYIA